MKQVLLYMVYFTSTHQLQGWELISVTNRANFWLETFPNRKQLPSHAFHTTYTNLGTSQLAAESVVSTASSTYYVIGKDNVLNLHI